MKSKFKGVATAKNEKDFDEIDSVVGTPRWQPPEIPEWTARGEVWVIAAISLSLCRQLQRGPLQPKPRNYDSTITPWVENADARKGIRDMGTGPGYSQQMEDLLWECLRFSMGNRPLSYELVVKIRNAEAETLGQKKIPLEPMPSWALKHA